MNANTVASTIIAGNFTNDELASIIEAVKYARSRLQKQTIRSLMLGDNVNFTSTKTGRNTTGTVYKIAQKYVTVRTIDGLWKVPANMLNLIEDWTVNDEINQIMSIRFELDLSLVDTLLYMRNNEELFTEQELAAYRAIMANYESQCE